MSRETEDILIKQIVICDRCISQYNIVKKQLEEDLLHEMAKRLCVTPRVAPLDVPGVSKSEGESHECL